MQANRALGIAIALAAALLAAPPGALGQSIETADGGLTIFDTDGDSAVRINSFATYSAGGFGRSATLDLHSSDGPTTFHFHAFQAQLILGGGTQEGILLLRDDHDFTTTVELDGRTGSLRLGGDDEDGDLILYDDGASETGRINGQNGTFTNSLVGNGLVKAWAKVDADGTVVSSWRCGVSATARTDVGVYRVDFSPLSPDIRSRPRMAVIDSHASNIQDAATITLGDSDDSTAAVAVHIGDGGAFVNPTDRAFTVFIY